MYGCRVAGDIWDIDVWVSGDIDVWVSYGWDIDVWVSYGWMYHRCMGVVWLGS